MFLKELADKANVKFGTSGVRGLVKDLSSELCFAYASAFIQGHKQTKKIAIGHDLRPSSPDITKACIAAAKFHDIKAIYLGNMPTPAVANFCISQNVPGIVITGSHIPFDRNGIKFYRPDGEISKDDELSIVNTEVVLPEIIHLEDLPTVNNLGIEAYKNRYFELFGPKFLDGLTIAIYEHSGVARDFLHDLFSSLGANTISLGRSESFVPIDTEAVRQEDVDQAKSWAESLSFDLLVSTDGDADRPLIADEQGVFLRGDIVGILTAKYLGLSHVVTPISSNSALERSGLFTKTIRTQIGSPYVIAGMGECFDHAEVKVGGYEANGGFLLGSEVFLNGKSMRALPTRDAILPMLSVIGLAKAAGVPVSKLIEFLSKRFTYSDRIQNFPKEKAENLINKQLVSDIELISYLLPKAESVTEINNLDGLRVTFSSGDIVHIRPSGNAPELRCYVESDSQKEAKTICDNALKRIQDY